MRTRDDRAVIAASWGSEWETSIRAQPNHQHPDLSPDVKKWAHLLPPVFTPTEMMKRVRAVCYHCIAIPYVYCSLLWSVDVCIQWIYVYKANNQRWVNMCYMCSDIEISRWGEGDSCCALENVIHNLCLKTTSLFYMMNFCGFFPLNWQMLKD